VTRASRARPAASAEPGETPTTPVSFHLLALVSGASALVYEILWMRRFAVMFGATTPAVATALSAMFLGLALGSVGFGALGSRWRRPLVAFGLVELGIGAAVLFARFAVDRFDPFYPALYEALWNRPAVFLAMKMALTASAILPATILMGGTLPLLFEAAAGADGRLGVRGGGLYAANVLGAAVGALAVPVVLLPAFGAEGAALAAIVGNMAVGIAALALGRHVPALRTEVAPRMGHPSPARGGRAIEAMAFASGVLLLGLEVLWARMFALVHENSVYSLAAVITLFLVGLSLGAALARAALRRRIDRTTLLAWSWTGAGAWILLSPRLFFWLTSGMEYLADGGGAAGGMARLLAIAAVTTLPATVLGGAVLPVLMEMAGERRPGDHAAPVVGRLLAINTVGSIIGPWLATFVLASRLGLWWSVTLVGSVMILAAGLTGAAGSTGPARRFAPLVALGVALVLLAPGRLPAARVDAARGERIVAVHHGTHGTVAVIDDGFGRSLRLDNSYVLGGTLSTGDERFQTHLPLLLHPKPRSIAFLGLGTGITAGASLVHPIEEAVALEIVPEVVEAARAHFGDANLGVVDDPRVEIRIEDARNFLKGTARRFDVVVGDLVVPWRPGEAALYAEEHFRAVRETLREGGIFCQWVPLFQLSEEGFRIVSSTFLDVFPRSTLWRGDFLADQPSLALIGHRDGESIDPAVVERRWHEIAPRLDRTTPYLADPAGPWLFLVGEARRGDAHFTTERRHRDDRPWLELTTPLTQATGRPHGEATYGRFVLRLADELATRPLTGSPLERLGARELRWRDDGRALWRASVLAVEGDREAASELGLRTLDDLPAAIRNAVVGTH
jgi:spermidine synthase